MATKEKLEILLEQIEDELKHLQSPESRAILLQTKARILIALIELD